MGDPLGWQLAQINIGRMKAAKGDPSVQPFYDELDRINVLAEENPGFVWRMTGEGDDATDISATVDPLLLLNISVWQSVETLFDFVYKTAHTPVMAQRKQWFQPFDGAHQALWWIDAGHIPTVNEGFARLWHLEKFGPTPTAFTFKARFEMPRG